MERKHRTSLVRHSHAIAKEKISQHALAVIKNLQANGHEAYLVGGSVRDLLLGASPKDFDVATDANPDEVRQLFKNSRIIGRRFRLVHVFYPHEIIEVATFRADPHKETKTRSGMILRDNVYGTIEEDVFRRDFTINALYYDIEQDQIIDYVGGFEDVKQKTIRTIGKPQSRFIEDPVRMLRALRFSAKLSFEIEAINRDAIHQCHGAVLQSSAARLFDEFIKMLYCGQGYQAFQLLQEFRLLELLLPLISLHLKNDADENMMKFIKSALDNTDARLQQGLSLNPAFILAVIYWQPLQNLLQQLKTKHKRFGVRYRVAYETLFNRKNRLLEIPKRLTEMMEEIWLLQYKLEQHKSWQAGEILIQPRFRAAYDFLLLRAKISNSKRIKQAAQWWTNFINEIRAETLK